MWDETARDMQVIWVRREVEYFLKWGWTGDSLNRALAKNCVVSLLSRALIGGVETKGVYTWTITATCEAGHVDDKTQTGDDW
jgi:hypothetical protein